MPLPRPSSRHLRGSLVLLMISTTALLGCSKAPEDTHPERWVSQRQALFKEYTRTLEPLGLMARERKPFNAVEFTAAAQALHQRSRDPWALFPPDSNYAPTRALPAVWAQPAEFEQAQQAFAASVQRLLLSAQAGTLEAAKPAIEDVQAQCKACHDKFRRP